MSDFIKVFIATTNEPFQAKEAAEKWLKENGYSYGVSQRGSPRGIMKGDYTIYKWRNLTRKEQSELDGVLYTGRDQDAKIVIKRNKPNE